MGAMASKKSAAQIQVVFTWLFRRYSYAEMPCAPYSIKASVDESKGRARRK